jgi:putative ABC transport system substrate-binding protein
MTEPFRRLSAALLLIFAAAAVLLWSDRHSRHSARSAQRAAARIPVALLQHSSNPLLDETRQGVLDGLAAKGFRDDEKLAIATFNPEGDLPTGNLMAQKIAGGDYRLAISISTVMLQALANANRDGRVVHVFGAVTSPVAAGVGIKALDGEDKPRHLTGIGTPQPVADIFRLARRLNPALKTVGVVWNPAEVNSEVCTRLARAVSEELGITLLEAPVEQTKDVREAAQSLVARGVEAFWTGGDVTVNNAVDSLISVAEAAHVPVFSNISGHARRGGLFDLGANYHEVGEEIGRIAGDVLAGADPARIPVRNFVPRRIMLNEKTRQTLGDAWRFDDGVLAEAEEIVQADGTVKTLKGAAAPAIPAPQPGRVYKVGVGYFAPEPGIDSVLAGLRETLKALGFEEGRNLRFRMMHAQAEIAQIPTLGQVLDNSDVDAILTLTTPVLQGAGMAARNKPVVFTYVTDPLAAGAGKSFAEHLPHLTGIGSMSPVEDMVAVTRKVLPEIRSLGTLYNPSEANSVKVATVLREVCKNTGLTLEEVPINTTAEVVQATQALVARKVGAIMAVGDNTMYQALDAVAKVARDAGVPLILDQPDYIDHDALMVVGIDYSESGRAAAEPLARILAGAKPADIPFRNVSKRSVLLNEASARRLGVVFPDEVRAMADAPAKPKQAGSAQPLDHTWKIKRLLYVESAPAEEALQGVDEGFKAAGLVAGRDYAISDASAQGDMATLSSLADAAASDGTELLIPFSTPTLQTALRKIKNIPIVFTFVADPILVGAGTDNEHHLPNVTGVYSLGPYAEMVDLLARYFPGMRKIGTLFSPAEDNSVHNKEVFAAEAAKRGISISTVPVNSPGELADAALALAARPIDAIVQTLDNQTTAGFMAIAKAAQRVKKPLLAFTESSVKQGAAVGLTLDYRQAGFDAALKAAAIMRGQSPAEIPFSRPSKLSLVVSEDHARTLGMALPAELVAKADKRLGQ